MLNEMWRHFLNYVKVIDKGFVKTIVERSLQHHLIDDWH